MAYIPCRIGGGEEQPSKVLLWLNPSPTTAFAAQTLSMDLSDYEAVIIRFSYRSNYNTDNQKLYQLFNYVPKDGIAHWVATSLGSGSTSYLYGRDVTVTDTGIVFTNAGYGTHGSTSGTDTLYIIPTEIYGLKYTEPTYPDDPRKFILKNGVFQGTQGTDYGVLGTPTQNVGFVTLDGTDRYANGIGAFISASDKTKYKRLVFDCDGTYGAVRMYYSTTETGSRTQLNAYMFAINLTSVNNDVFLYLMPSSGGTTMNYYNIYLE